VEKVSALVDILDALRDDVLIVLPTSVENMTFLLTRVEVVIVDVTFMLFAVISDPDNVENFKVSIAIFEPTALEKKSVAVLIFVETYNVDCIDTNGVLKCTVDSVLNRRISELRVSV
jgi:hypothetical protein